MSVSVDFMRKDPENDSARLESVCSNCSQRISAYTAETLSAKELNHKCRVKRPVFHPRLPLNSPKQKLY
jgi:predicted HNH restriction endonuclease